MAGRSGQDSLTSAQGRPPARLARSLVVLVVVVAVVATLTATAQGLWVAVDGARGRTVPVPVEDAAWTTAERPNTVVAADSALRVDGRGLATYLHFDLTPAAGSRVVAAELVLTPDGGDDPAAAAGPGLQVRRVTGDWSAPTITHNRRPGLAEGRLGVSARTIDGVQPITIDLDVTTIDQDTAISLQITRQSPGPALRLLRSGPEAPRLVLTVEPVADAVAVPGPSMVAPLVVDGAAGVRSSKLVLAHYFPPYPLSIDNQPADQDYYTRHYLTPSGEGGRHAEYGGLLRDRPLPVAPSADAQWRLHNLETEVRQAKIAGIDGFVVDLLSAAGQNWQTTELLMQAAENVGGFTVVPMVDATAPFAQQSPEAVAGQLAVLLAHDSAHRLGDDHLVSSFAAERKPVDWWRQVLTTLRERHHLPVSFQAVFLNASTDNLTAFAPIADGFGSWGVRTADAVARKADHAARAHRMGKTWMEPVALQDVRPRSYLYAESLNTTTFRAMLTTARRTDADSIQVVTWNDYSEGTQVAPSRAHGWAPLSMISYYATWFHTGTRPTITTDTVVVSHRIQPVGAPVSHRPMRPSLGGADTTPRDAVEVLVFLTAAAEVTVTVGGHVTTYQAPAGVSAHTVPLHPGEVSATVRRSGVSALTATSPHRVTAHPRVQDLQYYTVVATR